MNAMPQHLFEKGDFVEMVDLSRYGPLEVPLPQRWFVLRVHREFSVIKTFKQRNISAYLPLHFRTARRDGGVARRPHLGRSIVSPLIPGLVFIPDFECEEHRLRLVRAVDGVAGFLQLGPRIAFLTSVEFSQLLAIEAIGRTPPKERARLFALGQLVRITEGPFAGFEGMIERLDSKGRLRVFLSALKRGVTVITTEAQIEPVPASTDATTVRH